MNGDLFGLSDLHKHLPAWWPETQAWLLWIDRHLWWFLAGGLVLIFAGRYAIWRLFRPRLHHTGLHGSERWAGFLRLWWYGAFNTQGFVLGIAHGCWLRAPREQNAAFFAPPGEGKTLGGVTASIIARGFPSVRARKARVIGGTSAIIFDPSGELLEMTRRFRESIGPVYVWDPTSPTTDQDNPYDLVSWDTPDESETLQRLLSHTVSSEGLQTTSGAKHYERVADDCLYVMSLAQAHTHTPTNCTFEEMLEVFSMTRQPRQLLQRLTNHGLAGIRRGASRLLQQPPTDFAKNWSAAVEWLLRWEDPKLCYATARTTIPWQDLQHGDRPVTVYLRLTGDDAQGRLNRLVRMKYDLLVYHLSNRRPGAYVRELDWIFDDAALLGDFPTHETIAVEKRKYGFRLLNAYQSPMQIEPNAWRYKGLMASIGCWVIYRQNDPDSSEFLERKLAHTTVEEPVDRLSFDDIWSRQRSVQAIRRPLVTAGEFGSLVPGHLVVCIRHLKTRGKVVNVLRHRPFCNLVEVKP